MANSIYVKSGKIQFWGSPSNPTPVGIAFELDCCPCGCWEVSDNFNRPDTTDLLPDWIEISGDWGIDNNRLEEAYSP